MDYKISVFAISGLVAFSQEESEELNKMYMGTYSIANQSKKLRVAGILQSGAK